MRLEAKWRGAYELALERIHKETPGKIVFRLKVTLYPTEATMEDPADKCSACRSGWLNIDGAMNHAHGLPHFRQWCLEHPTEVRARFPEAVEVTVESTLTEDLVPA